MLRKTDWQQENHNKASGKTYIYIFIERERERERERENEFFIAFYGCWTYNIMFQYIERNTVYSTPIRLHQIRQWMKKEAL